MGWYIFVVPKLPMGYNNIKLKMHSKLYRTPSFYDFFLSVQSIGFASSTTEILKKKYFIYTHMHLYMLMKVRMSHLDTTLFCVWN